MQSTQLGRMLAVVARALVLLMLVELPPADSAASIEATPHHMDSFDDWETYQNESYGYSVRYPQHWTRIEYAPYYTRFVEGPYQIGNPVPETYMSILVMDNFVRSNLEDWLREHVPLATEPSFISMDGVRSAQWTNVNTLENSNSFVYIPNGSVIYQIALVTMRNTSESVIGDLESMRESFRITRIPSGEVELSETAPSGFSIPMSTLSFDKSASIQSYNRQAARNYATSYCNRNCDDGINFLPCGGDCAHFVSHSLKAGGLDDSSSQSCCGGCCNLIVYCPTMWNWFISTGSGSSVSSVNNLDVGDVIFYSWDGGPIWDHVTLVIENNGSGDVYIASHTTNSCRSYWTFGGALKYGFMHVTASTSPPPPPTCPTSGGDVILYYDANYGCAGKDENSGYVIRNGTGWQNVPGDFNDQASSVRVRSGWSVKLFEHSDRNPNGGWACRNSNDDNFWGDKFNNGVDLNDKVSSFEVFSSPNCGENHAPKTPSPQSPDDWHVARDGRAPILCWRNNGDPDGDQVEFYAEAFDSTRNANSGWTRGTCWRPGDLDGRYFNYQWRVKAKDSRGAESGWSTTWHFTIEAPNKPPSISFNTANGSSADRIETSDRNWTFAGTASDPENHLNRIEFRCDNDKCDHRGSGPDQTSGTSWSLTRTDMAGQNDVYFVAYDGVGQSTSSRHLNLRIDLAAPATTLSLNNEANHANWPAWFTVPVQVRLDATDNATGRARVGVKEVHYRLDNGAWQTRSGASTAFSVSSDGTHTVKYYAVDSVDNQEGSHSVTFHIDQTPPTPPTGIVETHGVPNGQWQKAQNVASFTWAASSDATSGLWGYQFYFGTDPNGQAYQSFLASDPHEWTPQPGGVRTGAYYLRGRTRDIAGNWSAWTDLFTFRFDGTSPENPGEAAHAAGITNDTWQRVSNLADFTWPVPHDEGSGVKDYAVYWGTDPAGTSSSRIPNPQYQSPTPLCGTSEACTGYLRLRSVDNVDNLAEDWSTAFVLRYDNAPPTVDFTFSGGVTQTTQTLVTLDIAADDQGSGVKAMRLSSDGSNWTPWEVYAPERLWTIPAISRQYWPVYVQVRDGVDLESAVVRHDIYLDVNPKQSRSLNYRLFDYALSAGSSAYSSTLYTGRGTVGQVADSPPISSTQYLLHGGYEAGSQAIPIVEPGHDEFSFINGIFASGTGGQTLTSSLFTMHGTLGEPGLPNNQTTLTSNGFQHQPGFLAAVPGVTSATPTPTPTPGPTPTPEPTPACEFPRISINNGALFTSGPEVTLNICAPRAVEMMLSNDGGFAGAQWEPYAESKPWTITTYGQQVLPRFVYAAFREANGTVHNTYFDDIIYDPNAPVGSIAVGGSESAASNVLRGAYSVVAGESSLAQYGLRSTQYGPRNTQYADSLALLAPKDDGSVDLYVNATDDNSGLTEMQVSADATFSSGAWEPYSALKPWTPEGGDGIKTVYARFRGGAGNVSASTETSFALDTMPPIGGITLGQRVVGPDTVTTTVFFGAEDNLSGVVNLRVAECQTPSTCIPANALADAAWRPYTVTLTWPISLTGQSQGALYVQYRDLAGNVSETYSDTYTVDTAPPVVYVEVEPGESLIRPVHVYAYDELADLGTMRLSNDPLLFDGVVTMPYTDTVEWTFDDRRVVWVQLADSVGNWSEPYPAYAARAAAPLAPVVDAEDTVSGLQLTWAHLDANARYEIWRDTTPYFDPDAPGSDTIKLADLDAPETGNTLTYTDTTTLAEENYYYLVRGVNSIGETSIASNRTGMFHFGIVPGNAAVLRRDEYVPSSTEGIRTYYLPTVLR